MKKFVATISLSLSAVFCIALANAQDSSTTTPPSSDTPTLGQEQAGELGEDSGAFDESTAATPNLCTDASGIIYRKGQGGFDRCMEAKGTTAPSEMGGEAGAEGTGTESHTGVDPVLEGSEAPTTDTELTR